MNENTLFMNGEFIPVEQGVISVRTHGFCYGTGCFEGIRAYWSEQHQQLYLFRAAEHFERLLRSCQILHISLPYTVGELVELTCELVRRNAHRCDVYIRATTYKTGEDIGVRLHGLGAGIILQVAPMGDYVATTGLRCAVSSWRRIDDNALPARAKICGAYVNSALAKSEALQNGFDEAIMLTSEGHVAEGSAENIFLFLEGALVTPAPSENILVGITRATVMELARRELGLTTCERQVDRTELYVAAEVFLCGTGAQIAPVLSVDHRRIGGGVIGPVSHTIQQRYLAIVRGTEAVYRDTWCTPVYAGAGVRLVQADAGHQPERETPCSRNQKPVSG